MFGGRTRVRELLPTTPELAVRTRLLADGGSEARNRFMDELRTIHLDRDPRPDDRVLAELDAPRPAPTRSSRTLDVEGAHQCPCKKDPTG